MLYVDRFSFDCFSFVWSEPRQRNRLRFLLQKNVFYLRLATFTDMFNSTFFKYFQHYAVRRKRQNFR